MNYRVDIEICPDNCFSPEKPFLTIIFFFGNPSKFVLKMNKVEQSNGFVGENQLSQCEPPQQKSVKNLVCKEGLSVSFKNDVKFIT